MAVKCEICGKEFANTQALGGHRFAVHSVVDAERRISNKLDGDIKNVLEAIQLNVGRLVDGMKDMKKTLDRVLGILVEMYEIKPEKKKKEEKNEEGLFEYFFRF